MNTAAYLFIVALVLSAGIAAAFTYGTRVFLRYRGKMLFTCPETGKPVAVKVAASKAALSSLTGRPGIRLSECSRWPERQDCGQECLSQIGADPQNCLVWTKVADWYRGRTCVYCCKPFGEIHWHDHRPALMGPGRKTVQWSELAPESLPRVLETYKPVCWSCHIAETFRREHPELVVDRPGGERGPMGELIPKHLDKVNKAEPLADV
ncbi:MAG TPA: hypothetical protein VOA64_20210 [Candidatus Dormibacteraeota bacterium]|nr:hypothetical protein [Candidatus Dormibacteraeota bacterium]